MAASNTSSSTTTSLAGQTGDDVISKSADCDGWPDVDARDLIRDIHAELVLQAQTELNRVKAVQPQRGESSIRQEGRRGRVIATLAHKGAHAGDHPVKDAGCFHAGFPTGVMYLREAPQRHRRIETATRPPAGTALA